MSEMLNQSVSGVRNQELSEEDVERVFERGGSLFRQLFDHSSIGMTVAAMSGQFLRVNPAFERFIGYTSDELTTMSFIDITHPEDIPLSEQIRIDIVNGVKPKEITEKRYLTKNGGTKWGSITRALVTDDHTGLELFVAQIQDVTEKVNAQRASDASEQRLAAFLNVAADRYWETDSEHRFVYISDPGWIHPRLSTDNLIGRTRWGIENSPVDPPWDAYRAILDRHEAFQDYEYHRIRPDGTESYIRTSGQPMFDGDGRFTGYRGINREISREITATQQAENKVKVAQQRLFDAMENIDAGIVLWDATGAFVYCNNFYIELQPEARDLTPGSRFEDFFDKVSKNHLSRIESEKDREAYLQSINERTDVGQDFDYPAVDGRWMRRRRQRLSDGAVVAFHTDITEQRRAENLKDEFVSLISHELRTPLTSVMGAVGLAMEGVTGEIPKETYDILEIAYRNCLALTEHVNNILDLSKIEAGEMVFNMAVVDVMPLVAEVIDLNSIFAEQLGCHYEMKSQLVGSKIFADPVRIGQTLTNLLSNAAKYAANSGAVDIGVTRRDGQIRISVTDRGNGIPHHLREKIFNRFTQAEETNNRNIGGTGLGLSIAKEIVEHHGGKIDFETEMGKGTTFYFELPEHDGASEK